MKVVIAIDSFKGSLSSIEAGNAAKEGILRVYKDASVFVRPVADGGEGTTEALYLGMGGEIRRVNVCGPLNNRTDAEYTIIKETNTAVIEMSAAAGITLINEEQRNPLYTTTYGVGEMIADAINNGCRNFIIGIGGSATNDGGIGMLSALGFEFLDNNKNAVPLGANGLKTLVDIKTDKVLKELKDCRFSVACDVTNPLCGVNGCSAVYGPQKGADEKMIKQMDAWLENYADITKTLFKNSNKDAKGAGAAGGLGFAFLSFLNAQLKNGIELILEKTQLEEFIKNADIVITGEGRLDSQSAMGKAPVGVAKLAKKHGKTVIAFSGSVTKDASALNNAGIDAFFPILRSVCSLEDAMNTKNAYNNMANTAEQVFRIIKATK